MTENQAKEWQPLSPRGQFPIYKTGAAIQFSLMPFKMKEKQSGAIYLEAAEVVDRSATPRTYKWKTDKIKFAIGPGDITQIFDALMGGNPKPIELFHRRGNDPPKKLVIKPGEGNYTGTWTFFLSDQGTKTNIMIPLSGGEFKIFMELLKASLPIIYGFDTNGLNYLVNK